MQTLSADENLQSDGKSKQTICKYKKGVKSIWIKS